MFLDTSGGSGGRWQDDEPQRRPKVANRDLAWLLAHLVTVIFLGQFAFAYHLLGQNAGRDSFLLLMTVPATAALAVFAWIVFEWYIAEVPHPDE